MNIRKSSFSSLLKNNYFYLVLVILLLGTYWTTVLNDVVLEYDDKHLLNSLFNIHGFKEYLQAIKNGVIFDLQPVRDLSYLADFALMRHFSYAFHFTNIIIWFLICLVVYRLLSLEIKKPYIVSGLVLFYCFSPVSTSSVAWIAGRKHLLSTLFILLCTYLVVKNKKDITSLKKLTLINSLYLLSCLSQPINALWPIWLASYLYFQQNLKKNKTLIITLFIIMLAILSLNYYYYSTIYVDKIGLGEKFQSDYLDIGSTALALGRYFYLSLFPFSALPVSHNKDAWENILGSALLLLSLSFLILRPIESKKKYILALIYFVLPLLLVSIRPTNVFCSDTYLLNSSVGIYWALAYLLDSTPHLKKILVALIIYASILFIYNLSYLKVFSDEESLWKYSQAKEANFQSTMIVALGHVKKNEFAEAYALIDDLQAKWPESPYIPQLIAESVFFNEHLSDHKKIEIIEKNKEQTPATHFYLSILYAREGRVDKVENNLVQVLKNPKLLKSELKDREERVAAIYQYTCLNFNLEFCDFRVETLKKQFKKSNFDESFYKGYLKHLLSSKGYTVHLQIK